MAAGFQNERLEEKQLEERLKGLKIDVENIAKVIAANTGKSVQEVTAAMLERTTLNPEEAKAWGLIQENTYCLSSENVMHEVFKQAWSIRLNIWGSQKRRLKR